MHLDRQFSLIPKVKTLVLNQTTSTFALANVVNDVVASSNNCEGSKAPENKISAFQINQSVSKIAGVKYVCICQ